MARFELHLCESSNSAKKRIGAPRLSINEQLDSDLPTDCGSG
jgi:hypothetical protein